MSREVHAPFCERVGVRFPYATLRNIYVKSAKAGQRVLTSVTQYLKRTLKLTVNAAKSAVDRPWKRKFLGFSFTSRHPNRRRIADAAIERLKAEVRQLTRRTRGVNLGDVIEDLRKYLLGWKAYFGFSEVARPLRDIDKWIARRLRCYLWKQWVAAATGSSLLGVCEPGPCAEHC